MFSVSLSDILIVCLSFVSHSWPINSYHVRNTVKVLSKLWLSSYSIFPITHLQLQLVLAFTLSHLQSMVHSAVRLSFWKHSSERISLLIHNLQVTSHQYWNEVLWPYWGLPGSVGFTSLALCLLAVWLLSWEAHSHRRVFGEAPPVPELLLSQSLYNRLLLYQENDQDPTSSPFYRKVRSPLFQEPVKVAYFQEDNWKWKTWWTGPRYMLVKGRRGGVWEIWVPVLLWNSWRV